MLGRQSPVFQKGVFMAKRKRATGKKGPGRPVTTGKGQLIGLRCHSAFIEVVDKWRADQAATAGGNVTPLTRPAAIVKLAELGLAGSK